MLSQHEVDMLRELAEQQRSLMKLISLFKKTLEEHENRLSDLEACIGSLPSNSEVIPPEGDVH